MNQIFQVGENCLKIQGPDAPVHGEFVIEVRRGGDPAPLLLSPMLGKLLVHEKCDVSDGASAGQTGCTWRIRN